MEDLINKWKQFIEEKLMPVINNIGENLEGNIYSYNNLKTYNQHYLEKQYNIALCGYKLKPHTHILEIGFNSGFSALLLLMASDPSVKITCVDINHHKYTVPCFQIIKEHFKERIELILGNSKNVLPGLKDKFDMIHIDGGHSTEIASNDIENSIRMSNNGCIIIMDDVNVECLKNAWEKAVSKYKLKDVDIELKETKFHSIKKYNC